MKSFGEFSKDSIWALDKLDEEGFKNAVSRRKKKRSSFLSARQQKIKDLKDRPMSWQGLE